MPCTREIPIFRCMKSVVPASNKQTNTKENKQANHKTKFICDLINDDHEVVLQEISCEISEAAERHQSANYSDAG